MNGQMRKYKASLKNTSEPILLSNFKQRMDLKGLMQYAKDKGVKVSELSEKERLSFVKK